MVRAHVVRRVLALAALVSALMLVAVPAASAHSRTVFSLGFVFAPPLYDPPPPVYYYPPVYYAPPPAVYVQPAPIAAQPASPSYQRNGQICREYRTTVVIGGVQRPSYGTACLQPDGSWRIVG